MAPITVTLDEEGTPAAVVSLLGENDGYVAERLENELRLLIDNRTPIVVDLTEATFIDSQVLSVLLSARYESKLHRLGYALALSNSRYTQVHRLLDMTGLYALFDIEPTIAEALTTARGRPAATTAHAPRSAA